MKLINLQVLFKLLIPLIMVPSGLGGSKECWEHHAAVCLIMGGWFCGIYTTMLSYKTESPLPCRFLNYYTSKANADLE